MASRNSLERASLSLSLSLARDVENPDGVCIPYAFYAGMSGRVSSIGSTSREIEIMAGQDRTILIISETRYYTYECCPR